MWPGDRAAGRDALRCRYHGWRFNLDGALIGAPDFDGQRAGVPAGLSGCGLQRVPVVEALGLVWAWLGTGSPAPSPDQDGPLHAALAPLGLGAWRARRRASHSLACNWKTYVENYLEGYHIPYLHPGLSRELHLEGYAVEPVGPFGVRHLAPTAPGALNEGLWLWVWPNVAINVYGRAASLERMVPVGPTTTRIDYVYLADDRLSDEALDALVAMSARTTDEDKRICEAVAHNLRGGRARPGPLSPRHEAGLAQFHALLRAAWAPTTADPADPADLGAEAPRRRKPGERQVGGRVEREGTADVEGEAARPQPAAVAPASRATKTSSARSTSLCRQALGPMRSKPAAAKAAVHSARA
jgi:choline monooxygenase